MLKQKNLHKENVRDLSIFLASLLFLPGIFVPVYADDPAQLEAGPKSQKIPLVRASSRTDFSTPNLTAEAMELADQLKIVSKLQRLDELRQSVSSASPGKTAAELKEEIRDLKEEICEVIEQTRLEIDYVRAELSCETALQSELVQSYTRDRDNRVFNSNVWSFRTNGVLWALAEALSIPTYSHPRYSVSSGTIGILAGMVPTAFSILALRQSQGGKFERQAYPNMLSKIFDYPVVPRVDYPQSVWDYLHSRPAGRQAGKTRVELLISQWVADKNIHFLTDKTSKAQMDMLTGAGNQKLSIDLLSDRVCMMKELDAMIGLMNRPLLEIMMAVRGSKRVGAG